MKSSSLFKITIFIIFFSLNQSASAASNKEEGLPLWEIGLGVGAVHQSYYTGTKQSRVVLLPIPVPIYRGKILKSDDEGIRAQLFKNERAKLDLSMDFNPQLNSEDIDLREGMSDIGNIVQIGPSIEVSISKKEKSRLNLNLPLRVAFEIGEDGVDSRGFNFSPHLTYHHELAFADKSWVAGISLGPQFGNADYHDIYYGVGASDATQSRSAYKTDSGYSGSRLQLTMKSNNSKRLLLGFLRYENIDGATFDDSPLVETKDNLVIGFLYSRYLFKSKKRVPRKTFN
jgi:outer membrane protein